MTLTNWITPGTMQSLGWALVHFLWQGTALAALAASAMAMFRRPATRYRIGVGALALMLVAPIATFWFYSVQRAGSSELVRSLPPVATGGRDLTNSLEPARCTE